MTPTRTPNSHLIGNMDNKLKNCMIKVSLGASLAFAPLVDCNGGKKETPAVNPEPVNPKLTPQYWQDRLDTLLNQVKEYGDVEFTPETYTPYLEALNRFQELLKKAEQGYLNNYTVGEYELCASNLAAKIANLQVQIDQRLTLKYWQDRLETLLNSVKEYGDVTFTPETYTPYLEELDRYQQLLKKAEQGYLTNYTVGEYELCASNLAAKIANLKVQTKEENTDPYNQPYALINALKAFFPKVADKQLSEQEQKKLSDELKKIYVEAFAKDTYSANFPFSSKQLKAAMTPLEYHFPYGGETYALVNAVYLNVWKMTPYGITGTALHETGHIWGLGESLTDLQTYKYMGLGMGVSDPAAVLDDLLYSPFYDNLLLEKVGDKKFWGTIYEGQANQANARYGKMWDENMVVTVNNKKEPLVSYYDMGIARYLSNYANNRDYSDDTKKVMRDFEQYTGIIDIKSEFKKLGPVFEKAFKNNDLKSVEAVQKFFGVIKDYNEKFKTLRPWAAVGEYYLNNFLNNMTQYKTQTQGANQDMIRVNLGQEVGCCR